MTNMVLFLGALLDAFIGVNLFVHGEPFLLTAGYQLYRGNVWAVIAVAFGGLLGDQISFFIGRGMGTKAQRRLLSWQPKTKRSIARFRLLMRDRGNYLLMFARLLGPVAWVVPFLAGSQQVSWQRFSFFSGIGLILGVGQWITWGYLLASGVEFGLSQFGWWQYLDALITEHQSILAMGLLLLVLLLSWLVSFLLSRRLL